MSGQARNNFNSMPDVASTAMLEKHIPLVKKIARNLLVRLPNCVLLEDLTQAGMIGLIEAYQHFRDDKGASFETYAGIRIRGAMLDEIRKGDWSPRSVHRNSRAILAVMRKIEHTEGRTAKSREIAEGLGISLSEYHQMLQDTHAIQIFSFEDFNSQDGYDTENHRKNYNVPLEYTYQSKFKEALSVQIKTLPEREAFILTLYYDEDKNLKEIGDILGVSESRVSQMHSQAMLRLRSRLEGWRG